MKRTTYIFIGMFFACILFIFTGLYYIKTQIGKYEEAHTQDMALTEEVTETDFADIHTLDLSLLDNDVKNRCYIKSGEIKITVVPEGAGNRIKYPKSEYIKLVEKDGVLKVRFEMHSTNLAEKDDEYEKLPIENLNLEIAVSNGLKAIHCASWINVNLNDARLDSLYLNARLARLDRCSIGALAVASYNFTGNSLHVSRLHVDLDELHSWQLSDSKVDITYLAGSHKSRFTMGKEIYGRIVWEPKTDQAELELAFNKRTDMVFRD